MTSAIRVKSRFIIFPYFAWYGKEYQYCNREKMTVKNLRFRPWEICLFKQVRVVVGFLFKKVYLEYLDILVLSLQGYGKAY